MSKEFPLADFDFFVFDCDGVLYEGSKVISGSIETLRTLVALGKKLFFVTNNSRLSTEEFAAKFEKLGLGEFVQRPGLGNMWSAVTATQHWFMSQPPHARTRKAFVLGHQGLKRAIEACGVVVANPSQVRTDYERAVTPEEFAARVHPDKAIGAVVLGFDEAYCYHDVAFATACLLENPGCAFLATNRDYQFPCGGRKLPGNGAIVAAVATAVRREPDVVAGKPSPFILHAILAELGRSGSGSSDGPGDGPTSGGRTGHIARRTLVVGDMWSDVEFGHAAGCQSALVLTGVATLAEAEGWVGATRPDHILRSVRGLTDPACRIAVPALVSSPPCTPAAEASFAATSATSDATSARNRRRTWFHEHPAFAFVVGAVTGVSVAYLLSRAKAAK